MTLYEVTRYGDRWHPLGTHDVEAAVGNYVAVQHKVWRIVRIDEVPRELWTDEEVRAVEGLRPAWAVKAAPCRIVAVRWDCPTEMEDAPDERRVMRMAGRAYRRLSTYPGGAHFPACPTCAEPFPCRDQHGARITAAELARMARYEQPGICPACLEPISTRQKVITWEDNVEVPLGPPVSFHAGRGGCRHSAADYERRWAAADPERRPLTLSCPGHVTNHGDTRYYCTAGVDCPGAHAEHRSYDTCRCPEHWPAGTRPQCHPRPDAERIPLGEGGPGSLLSYGGL